MFVVKGFMDNTAPAAPVAPAVTAKPSRRGLKIALGVVALMLLLCVGSVAIFAGGLVKATSGPHDAATGFFTAIANHDWATAGGYDSTATGTTASELEQSWGRTEAKNGRLLSSSVASTNISNDTATVEGTLKFEGTSAPFTLDLVKVGDTWKLK